MAAPAQSASVVLALGCLRVAEPRSVSARAVSRYWPTASSRGAGGVRPPDRASTDLRVEDRRGAAVERRASGSPGIRSAHAAARGYGAQIRVPDRPGIQELESEPRILEQLRERF